MSAFNRIEQGMYRFSGGLALLGGAGLLFATFVTCISIFLKLARRVMDDLFGSAWVADTLPWLRPILGEEELVTFGVGFALFAALPWVMIRRGHIKVDLFKPVLGARLNLVLDMLGDLLFTALAYLIMTRQWFLIFKKARGSKESLLEVMFRGDLAGVVDRVRNAQESQILGLPLWPTYIAAQICVTSFFVVACFCLWRSARALWISQLRQAA